MRYLPLTPDDRAAMLRVIGAPSVDAFYEDVPRHARLSGPIHGLRLHQGELAVERHLMALAGKNQTAGTHPFFVGCGAYKHHVPATVDHIIQRSEFLTTYTPYQPEIAQGTLQTLFEFQTQVAALTAMDVANASMYDGSTACAEAAVMACRVTRRKKVIVSGGLHPHYAAATKTLCEAQGLDEAGAHRGVRVCAHVRALPHDARARGVQHGIFRRGFRKPRGGRGGRVRRAHRGEHARGAVPRGRRARGVRRERRRERRGA